LKKKLSSEERKGLEALHVRQAEDYLSLHGNVLLNELEASAPLEAFLVGYSIEEVSDRYPEINKSKLIATAAIGRWYSKRQEIASSIYDRVKAKLIRSVVEQVDYMTDLLSVASTEGKETISAYLKDPLNNPPPANRIRSIKEYKDAIDSLTKLTEHVQKITGSREEAISKPPQKSKSAKLDSKYSSKEASLLAELVGSSDE
jgi:hypothetical protein